jgi:hypothetical protein
MGPSDDRVRRWRHLTQVHTHQNDVDDYVWTVFASRKDTWVKLFEIHYHRTQP